MDGMFCLIQADSRSGYCPSVESIFLGYEYNLSVNYL